MQGKTIRWFIAITLMAVCLLLETIIVQNNKSAFAGLNGGEIIKSEMFDGEKLSIADWKYRENGLSLENGTIHFDKKYGLNNPLLSRTEIFSSSEIKETLTVSFKIKIQDIEGDKRFGIGYGINRLDGNVDSVGSTFVYFCRIGSGIGVGVSLFKTEGEKKLLSPNDISLEETENKYHDIAYSVFNDGTLILTVDGNVLFSGAKDETRVDGFVGFSALGSRTSADNFVDIYIRDVYAYNQYYDKPENVLISAADFDNGEFNTNEWVLSSRGMAYHDGVIVRDDVLEFSGAGGGSNFVNQYAYSNFELQYDIFDVKNDRSYAPDGRPILPSFWQAVYWGLKTPDAQSFATNAEGNHKNMLYFDAAINFNVGDENFGKRTGDTALFFIYDGSYRAAGIVLPEKYRFMNEGFTGKVRIRVRVCDGVLTVGLKLIDELEYEEVYRFEYPNGLTTTGYVGLGGTSNQFASSFKQYMRGSFYKIDNIVICNYDINPTLVQTSFKSNVLTPIPDAEYNDPYVEDYLIINTGGKGTKNR